MTTISDAQWESFTASLNREHDRITADLAAAPDPCPACDDTGLVPTIAGSIFQPPEYELCDCPSGDEAHRRHLARWGARIPAHVQVEPACEACGDRGCAACADWFAGRDVGADDDYSSVPF